MGNFVSLHNKTCYSILKAIPTPKDLLKHAKDLGYNAIAITDSSSIASAWEALQESKKLKIKLIIGCDFLIENQEKCFANIVLLAKNAIGYKNLLTLNKLSFDNNLFDGSKITPHITFDLLKKYNDGIICLTGCGNGIISQKIMRGLYEEGERLLLDLKSIFADDLAIEVLPNNMKRFSIPSSLEIDQQFINKKLIDFGIKNEIKIIAACNSHYLNKEDHEVHDVLLSIGSHQPISSKFRLHYNLPQFYLKSESEVFNFFNRNYPTELVESFIENSSVISDRCEYPDWIDPKYSNSSGKELPKFPIQDELDYEEFLTWKTNQPSLDDDVLYLRFKCEKNFYSRVDLSSHSEEEYRDRINEELEVLEFHGFSSYFLIVADYINWAVSNDIPVGEGRGSVGGSLVAYLLKIHHADPLKYNMIFARFHNKEKTSMPDIDTDFASSGRIQVKEYLNKKYGNEHVAHVSNVNRITPKVYVRDISRACELGGSKDEAKNIGNEVANTIPADIRSIDEAIEKCPLFSAYCKKFPEFIKYQQLCNTIRAWSTHAGGIIISSRPLVGLIPLRVDADGTVALEYEKEKAESNGLVKMDILGLSALDVIKDTFSMLREKNIPIPDIKLHEYDKKTYDLISSGKTGCVFQFGKSAGTTELCKSINPTSISDLANINALARPSAKDIRLDFIRTKSGEKPVKLLDKRLERAFKSTLGFGLYEESLMFLAQDVAGWSLHSADRLRKLTKDKGKNPEKAKKLREEFINDSIANGVEDTLAKKIWDEVIENFQGYGFNASHAILYSLISFKTAYLKAHYPIEFLLASLKLELGSNNPDSKIEVEKIKSEIRSLNIKILPPDINKSLQSYLILNEEGSQALLSGFDCMNYLGEDAVIDIIEKRPFSSFYDFMSRVTFSKVRSTAIQALAASGALDCFNLPRKLMFLYVSDYRKKIQTHSKRKVKKDFNYPWEISEWSIIEKYALEKHYMNEAFCCKSYEAYGNFFKDTHITFKMLPKLQDRVNIASSKAIIKSFFEFTIKKETSKYYGQKMLRLMLEDRNGIKMSCAIFPNKMEDFLKKFKTSKIKFEENVAIHFSGTAAPYEGEVGLIMDSLIEIYPYPKLPNTKALSLSLKPLKEKDIPIKDSVLLDLADMGFIN